MVAEAEADATAAAAAAEAAEAAAAEATAAEAVQAAALQSGDSKQRRSFKNDESIKRCFKRVMHSVR